MKRYQLILLSLLTGFLLSLPWLDLFSGWILLGAFVPLLFVESSAFKRSDQIPDIEFFSYAFLAFFTWNLLTCWWIAYAAFFGMLCIVSLNSLLMALVWWLFHRMRRTFNAQLGHLALIALWLAYEYLLLNWDMEWPWLNLGHGFANQVKLVQWYEYTGVFGGSLWVLSTNLVLFLVLKSGFRKLWAKAGFYSVIFCLFVVIPIIWSLNIYKNYSAEGETCEVVVLQPNIDPYFEKFQSDSQLEQLNVLLQLTDSLLTDSTDFLIGPETALPSLVEDDQLLKDNVLVKFKNRIITHPELNIVLGANTRKYFQPEEQLSRTVRKDENKQLFYDVYNSALLINHTSNIQVYHKSKLVSGVEKMPFSQCFSFIEKYIVDLGGATGSLGKQEESTVFTANSGVKVAPVICFESAFGQHIGEFVKKGAQFIFIITNDGWWKDSPGGAQHLSFARLRAIEARRSIARSANTGISALIDQKGDIVRTTALETETGLRGILQPNDQITFYVRYGDYIGRMSAFVAVLLLLYFFVQLKTKKGL